MSRRAGVIVFGLPTLLCALGVLWSLLDYAHNTQLAADYATVRDCAGATPAAGASSLCSYDTAQIVDHWVGSRRVSTFHFLKLRLSDGRVVTSQLRAHSRRVVIRGRDHAGDSAIVQWQSDAGNDAGTSHPYR